MIKVLDDVIPEHLQDYFELSILGLSGDKMMHPIVDLKCKYELTAREESFAPLSFVHVLKSSNTISTHLPNFGLIPQLVFAKENIQFKDILVGRIFVLMPYKTNKEYYDPHTDLPYPHLVVLYYVNDSDGDTVFFDNNNNVVQRVTPKKGRVVLFDGNHKHGGGIPKNGPRCAINFNLAI